jgi:hypothetical protein
MDERERDPLVEREERAAAGEAGSVGGPAPEYAGDEESRPLEEAGGGEAAGLEEAERELGDQAGSDPEEGPDDPGEGPGIAAER